MPEPTQTPSSGLRALLVLPLVAGWVALLVLPGFLPDWMARSSLAGFAPLGFLSVFAFRDQGLRLTRLVFVALPAFALGTLAATIALAWRMDVAPGPSDLVFPALAVASGVVVGLAWRRGPFALILLPFKLALLAVLGAVLGLGLLLTLADRTPAMRAPSPVTLEEKQQLVALLRNKDPRSLAQGEVSTLLLTQPQIDRLAAWLLPQAVALGGARVRVVLPADETVEVRVALPLPLGRWLNGAASAQVQLAGGTLELARSRLRIGRSSLPATVARVLAPALTAAIRSERRLRPLLAPIREAHVERGLLSVSYGRSHALDGPVADLLWGALTPEPVPTPERAPVPRPSAESAPVGPTR